MFACHMTKKILYETVFRDGSFLTQAASELEEIRQSEKEWCQWIELTHHNVRMQNNFTDVRETSHSMLKCVTHLHPFVMRYLLAEFRKKMRIDKEKVLIQCLVVKKLA